MTHDGHFDPRTDAARWAQTVPGADFRRVYSYAHGLWFYTSDGMWGRELWLCAWMVAVWSLGDSGPMPFWWQMADIELQGAR